MLGFIHCVAAGNHSSLGTSLPGVLSTSHLRPAGPGGSRGVDS